MASPYLEQRISKYSVTEPLSTHFPLNRRSVFEMSDAPKPCFAKCEFFRCGQRTLYLRGNAAWCRFADDECDVKTCKYAQCVRDRLLLNGVCGLTVKTRNIEVEPEELAKPIRIRGKLSQKIKEKELY